MTKARQRYDGKWRCNAMVHVSGMVNNVGCSHLAKHDPDENGNPTKCGVHSTAAKAKREAKRKAKRDKEIWGADQMSDDLVKWLRENFSGYDDQDSVWEIRLAAADRIEELEANLAEAADAIDYWRNAEELEMDEAIKKLEAVREKLKGQNEP
jgi:hypothetical protein